MHTVDLSFTKEMTKVEGSATLDVVVKGGKVERCTFGITEYKRFYTQAMRGKAAVALPQLLARICGTCSNAHLLCSIEACENALGVTPTPQSWRMKQLTMYGLNLRDHALHLYLFALPDMWNKDSFFDFDENDNEQHEILHDAFAIKAAGNALSILIAGRSVHAVNPAVGGFRTAPVPAEVEKVVRKLQEVRFAVIRTIERFEKSPFSFDRKTHFMALTSDPFSFLAGKIRTDDGTEVAEEEFRTHLERVVIPYSHAHGYKYKGASYMVGALARLNLSRDTMHPATKRDAARALERFPSTNIFDNNLSQAIELLHCVDQSLELLKKPFKAEPLVPPAQKEGVGVGVIEAPRGTLYHKVHIGPDGKVIEGEIVVPTGQNQINIEQDLARVIKEQLPKEPTQEKLQWELEKLVRAYDPCMSCASHFLTVKVEKSPS